MTYSPKWNGPSLPDLGEGRLSSGSVFPDLVDDGRGMTSGEELLSLRRHIARLEKDLSQIRRRKGFRARRSPDVLFQIAIDRHGDARRLPISYISENVRQFGYESTELMDRETDLADLIHPEDRRLIEDILASGTGSDIMEREYTYRFRKADGTYRWVTHVSELELATDGRPDTLVGLLMDVTTRREKDRALAESHRVLDRQVDMLSETWEEAIGLLAAVTELRDPYTMGHQRRVTHLSAVIAAEMELDEKQAAETHHAALVHDIGKIKVPNDFLSKPGRLTDSEFAVIKEHASVGADLLRKIHLPWNLADIVVQHHERLDGSGYPHGVGGDEILLPARIIAVADVIEAMASHRPYRPALGLDLALDEVTTRAGRLYDRDVVDVCRSLFLDKGYAWSEMDFQVASPRPPAYERESR